jgi:hypothetical protein
MEPVIKEVFNVMLSKCTKEAKPIDIIKSGVEALQTKQINKSFKREIVKAVIEKIAAGNDGIHGTADDRLSPETLQVLIVLLESDVINTVIDGIVVQIKKINVKKCWPLKLW